jgi:alkylhydroperoxidase family enzyme
LHATADLTDEAWSDLRRHMTELAVVEIVMLAGFYRTVSYLTNSLRLPRETFAKRFPL